MPSAQQLSILWRTHMTKSRSVKVFFIIFITSFQLSINLMYFWLDIFHYNLNIKQLLLIISSFNLLIHKSLHVFVHFGQTLIHNIHFVNSSLLKISYHLNHLFILLFKFGFKVFYSIVSDLILCLIFGYFVT